MHSHTPLDYSCGTDFFVCDRRAKVALTVGVADISAEAAVKIAKKNISNNTETTIMVSWSGGGFIKPSKHSIQIQGRWAQTFKLLTLLQS